MSIAIIDADPDISIIVLLGEKNRISKQFFKKNQKTPRRNSKRKLKKKHGKKKNDKGRNWKYSFKSRFYQSITYLKKGAVDPLWYVEYIIFKRSYHHVTVR